MQETAAHKTGLAQVLHVIYPPLQAVLALFIKYTSQSI